MRQITALALLIIASACAGKGDSASPTAPNEPPSQSRVVARDAAGSATANQPQVSADTQTFPLLAGSFTITDREGDTIVGTYGGASTFGAGTQRASITLQINGGSGKFAAVNGSFAMKGVGSFADEGSFELDGHGQIELPEGNRTQVALKLRGGSSATCSPSERILISQSAKGSLGHAGRVTATLSHEVGSTGCFS
jgi:hypothetical protein